MGLRGLSGLFPSFIGVTGTIVGSALSGKAVKIANRKAVNERFIKVCLLIEIGRKVTLNAPNLQ